MNIRRFLLGVVFALLMVLCVAVFASAQDSGSMGKNVAAMKLTTIPPLPTCARGSVPMGDPAAGPSIIFARVNAGCIIPWHWHTPNENVMIVSGTALIDMKDAKSVTLTSGGYAMMMSHHAHQFTCKAGPCQFYVYSDAAFDLHYVDSKGNEMTPAAANKAVRQMAATQMK
jgi:hypothetical protein